MVHSIRCALTRAVAMALSNISLLLTFDSKNIKLMTTMIRCLDMVAMPISSASTVNAMIALLLVK